MRNKNQVSIQLHPRFKNKPNTAQPKDVVLDRAINNLLSSFDLDQVSESLQRITGRRLTKNQYKRGA